MENTNPNACSAMEGGLPGKCANLAFPYIAMQGMNAERYDQAQALALYTDYVSLAKEGKKRYEAAYGPLQQTSVTAAGYTWLNNPWPWELEGGER